MSDYLDEGAVINILRRLPIKNVVQCTAVCKSWYALIRSPFFISTHLNSNSSECRLLIGYCNGDDDIRRADSDGNVRVMKNRQKYCLLNNDNRLDKHSEFESPFDCVGWCYRVVGCCNGLLCLSEDDDWDISSGVMILWNPAIRKSVLLPKPTLHLIDDNLFGLGLGFGFDSEENDYKVVRFSHSCDGKNRPGAEVYALSKNAWRDISHLTPSRRVESMASPYFEGAVHWVARNTEDEKLLVVAFDMGKEVFGEFPLPENVVNSNMVDYAVLVYKESLAVTTYHRHDRDPSWAFWVMKDYGDPNSWTKFCTIDSYGGFDQILWFTKTDQALFVTGVGGRLASQDLKRPQYLFLQIDGYVRGKYLSRTQYQYILNQGCVRAYCVYDVYVSTYAESLVLLDRGEDGCDANTSKALRMENTNTYPLEN